MYDWDETKNQINKQKHGVSFEEAQEALETDEHRVIDYDFEHSTDEEDRFQILAWHAARRVLYVVLSEQSGRRARLVSARRASRAETQKYRAETQGR